MGLRFEVDIELSESLKRKAIKLTSKILLQSTLKDLVVGRDMSEQSYRGSKLHTVNMAQDFIYQTPLNKSYQVSTFS
jgi:hypothetical protein